MTRVLLLSAALLFSSCGYVGREVIDHVIAIQTRAAAHPKKQPKPCEAVAQKKCRNVRHHCVT